MILSVAPLRSRVRAWSSESVLYTTSLRSSPRSYILYQNLGVLDQEAGRAEGAIAYYTQALKLRPTGANRPQESGAFIPRHRPIGRCGA